MIDNSLVHIIPVIRVEVQLQYLQVLKATVSTDLNKLLHLQYMTGKKNFTSVVDHMTRQNR